MSQSHMTQTAPDRSVLLGEGHLEALRRTLQVEGVHPFVARSGASLAAVLRAGSGLPIRRGTRALIVAALEAP
jgi:hypothetical protein